MIPATLNWLAVRACIFLEALQSKDTVTLDSESQTLLPVGVHFSKGTGSRLIVAFAEAVAVVVQGALEVAVPCRVIGIPVFAGQVTTTVLPSASAQHHAAKMC